MISNEKGFTVIETIITLLLMSIITIIVMPSKHIVERLELKAQAQSLVADIRYTQKQAMSNNVSYVLKILTKDNLYIIKKNLAFEEPEKQVYIADHFKFSNTSTFSVEYTTKGTPGNLIREDGRGSGGTIELLSKHYSIKITIEPTIGRVRIYDILKN